MITSRRLSILGLALCITAAGATAPALARHVAAASAAPTVAVVGHVSTHYVKSHNPEGYAVHQMTLRITGSNFVPGGRVTIALVNIRTWEIVAKGSTYAEFAIRQCSWTIRDCSEPNPRAGTIDYRLRLSSAPAAANLVMLYRSAGRTGMHGVALR